MKEPENNFPKLETERLLLKITSNSASEIAALARDEPTLSREFLGTGERLEAMSERVLNALIDEYNNAQMIAWQIWEKHESQSIGQCEFSQWISAHDRAEIGYSLNQKYWRKGYMTEALGVVIAFGFQIMQLNRIEGRCHVNNFASARVMEKVGMQCEGILRQHIFTKNRYHDVKLYSILRSEWQGLS